MKEKGNVQVSQFCFCGILSYLFGTELHVSTMKEATGNDVTNQAPTHDPLNTANNESKQDKLRMLHFVSFVSLSLLIGLLFL